MAVHTSIRSFTASLARYGSDEIPDFQRGRLTVIAMEAARVITELTPVDIGRLKGNWQFTIGEPAEGEIERIDPSPEGTPGAETQREVLGLMARWNPGDWLWFHNGAPYATAINDGDGGREAFHMVERTVAHLQQWVGD